MQALTCAKSERAAGDAHILRDTALEVHLDAAELAIESRQALGKLVVCNDE